MNTISSIIQTLSDEEKRSFIVSQRQKNKRGDTKNIQLFKLLDTTDHVLNPDVLLYGKPSKGAFHALSKRVHDSLIDFIASKSFEGETSEEMEILKLLLASRIFFEQKQYKIAFKTILKAEQKAKTYDLFSILNEIYYTKIQYGHLNNKISLDELISDFRNNKEALQQEENLNLFYATIQNKLMQQKKDFVGIIKKTLSSFGISVTKGLTFRSLFKILEITNTTAQVTRDYYTILPFVEEAYSQIDAKENLMDKQLFYHIQILYYVANAYFRNRNFKTSMQYLSLMKDQMLKHQQKYNKRFFPQYTLLQTLNLNYTGNAHKAIAILESFDNIKYKDQVTSILDLKLGLIVCYIQQSQFRNAFMILTNFYHSDHWYIEKAGMLWVIKKNLVEIILHIELDHMDLVESRVNSFRKKHGGYLKDNQEIRILTFLKLTLAYYRKPEIATTKEFKTKVYDLANIPKAKQDDIFEISFYAWLKCKTQDMGLYETTLKLIS
ncbi:hypothetical protein D1816_21615 [Aquimarina sp. AD10]|uniref:hypothetical protein n=1 Tax=Aquimarina sp. AD10 TaxID=1714849 RepID=UPI000E53962E|nr:hypothetical protein [Aquimarina sp. AD10]AXT62829.1 hypothetical protein D1816_21615 [Aquimarina sp. AD10]RKN02013.1 hypothetical protein D7033_02980 [Aquimarina sp. AD10]